MTKFDRREHWEKIYKNKNQDEVSWYQPKPETSLKFFSQFNVSKNAKIIDIGGGDSMLVDHLLDMGYMNITVLDISESALEKSKLRLGSKANKVTWIVEDAVNFKPVEKYDFWHDRAAFHFLTYEDEVEEYLKTAQKYINPNGVLIIGTFSKQGPKKCSGIEIKQYSENTISDKLKDNFEKITCITEDHKTPFNTYQNFIFCSFRKQ